MSNEAMNGSDPIEQHSETGFSQAELTEMLNAGALPLDHIEPNNVPPPDTQLIETVLQQLQGPEMMGFLRGNIILLSCRLGTNQSQPGDAERLDQFNFFFQSKLRQMIQENQQQQAQVQQQMKEVQEKGDADARSRGFESTAEMQEYLSTVFKRIEVQIKQWHAATEPGGDVTDAPDTNQLLFDVYLVTQGVKL